MKVTLRLLEEEDARKSWRWRNDPEVWQLTGSKPDLPVTEAAERQWVRTVLQRTDEIRFAICAGEPPDYIGNVQLTKIRDADAEFHIFIGQKEYHNRGIGTLATKQVLDYALQQLGLQQVYLFVRPAHTAAIKVYQKCGFMITEKNEARLTMLADLR